MMKHFTKIAAAGALAAFMPMTAPAAASPITITDFLMSDLNDAKDNFSDTLDTFSVFSLTEDFEGFGLGQEDGVGDEDPYGFDGATLKTKVGDITAGGADGAGDAAKFDVSKNRVAEGNVFGRQNTTRKNFDSEGIEKVEDHEQFLESNDVQTMTWVARDDKDGRSFNRLLFALTDPADTGATLKISSDELGESQTKTLSGETNGSIFNILVSFENPVTSATVTLTNLAGPDEDNDGWGMDGNTVGAVPLPAAAWLLMFASGGLIAAKRRQMKKAA